MNHTKIFTYAKDFLENCLLQNYIKLKSLYISFYNISIFVPNKKKTTTAHSSEELYLIIYAGKEIYDCKISYDECINYIPIRGVNMTIDIFIEILVRALMKKTHANVKHKEMHPEPSIKKSSVFGGKEKYILIYYFMIEKFVLEEQLVFNFNEDLTKKLNYFMNDISNE
jgi:hypothetical protein